MINSQNIVFNNYSETIKNYCSTHKMRTVTVGKGKHCELFNYIPMGFDIETTTQYKKENGKVIEHYSNMYIWQFQLDDITIIGRTWNEFSRLLTAINNYVCMNEYKTLLFIHNMSFEFAFGAMTLQKLGHSIQVFAREKRKPMKWTIDENLIFLDSFLLTHLSLENLAKNYCKTQKLKGDLDYTLLRNKHTELTEQELQYCINDVRILAEYSQHYYIEYLSKHFLPLTQTMIANKRVKETIKKLKAQKEVYYLMCNAYPKSKEMYDYIMSFYTGAYTHGYIKNLFKVIKGNKKGQQGLLAYDVGSEYPFVMMTKYYPMTEFRELKELQFAEKFLEKYCCLIEVELINIKSKYGVTILSKNKVYNISSAIWDNGRLYKAKTVTARITEIDLQTLKLHYDFEYKILRLHYAKRGFLPDYMRLTLIELYDNKSKLKPLSKTSEYYQKLYTCEKECLNAQYGSCCVRLNFNEITFNINGWNTTEKEINFNKIWESKNKLPQWAVYITAWARNYILTTIAKICEVNPMLYIYSDTDSIKCVNTPQVKKIFDDINKETLQTNINGFMKDYNLTDEHYKILGAWDLEHSTDFKAIKTLGSKRYLCLYEKDGKKEYESTISGLPKKAFLNYCQKYNLNPFDAFNENNLSLSDNESDKLCSYYVDEPKQFTVVDYQGNVEEIKTDSYVSLIPTTFDLKVTGELQQLFLQLLNITNL